MSNKRSKTSGRRPSKYDNNRGNNKTDRENSEDKKEYTGKKPNDIGWHAKSPQLLKDAASVPWSWATGKPIHRETLRGDTSQAEAPVVVPGIFTMKTAITPGVGNSASDAINIAAQAVYTNIRRMLKSANAYDKTDVIIYLTMIAEILSIISWITRLYATTMLYSFSNTYLPDTLLKVQGIDPDSLHNHASEFRSRANQLIAKASQIWAPKGFDYNTRARWLYANYYTEGESVKDQLYMFTPGLFRKFELLEETDYAGALVPFVRINRDELYTWEDVCDWLEEMINSLIEDSDFQNIAGDLFNCYGSGGVETFSLIPEDAIVSPVLSYEVLEQMQNSHCCTAPHMYFVWGDMDMIKSAFAIKQNETRNVLEINRQFIFNKTQWTTILGSEDAWTDKVNEILSDCYAPIITVDKDPSDAKTMLVTRDTNIVVAPMTGGPTAANTYINVEVAAEWVLDYSFYSFDASGDLVRISGSSNYDATPQAATQEADMRFAALISAFHYHPLFYIHQGPTNPTPSPFVLGSVDIVAPLDTSQIKDLNRVDLMSLFAVPDVGRVTK